MKKTYYEKIGRKYIPVREYDSDLMDSYSEGAHLVVCKPGVVSKKYNIDPNYAAMLAASHSAKDAICKAIIRASEYKPSKEPLTPGQAQAWNQLKKEFGGVMYGLQGVSIHDCVEAGIKAMMEEADKLMQNPAAKNAFEHFITVAALSKKQESC